MLEIKRLQGILQDLIGVMASVSAPNGSPEEEIDTPMRRTAVSQAASAVRLTQRALEQNDGHNAGVVACGTRANDRESVLIPRRYCY
jgi:hypothetical protein